MASRLGSIASSSVASRSSASLVSPAVLAMSDTAVPSVDAHLFDYLNIEMMQLLLDSSTRAQEKQDKRREIIERELEDEYQYMSLRGKGKADRPDEAQRAGLRQAQIQEGVRLRLEGIGYRLGYCLAERLARERPPIPRQTAQQQQPVATGVSASLPASSSSSSLSATTQPPLDSLEVVKFICKDVWTTLYDKQIDNLRTNHRGVFVLVDAAYKPLIRLSAPSTTPNEETLSRAKQILAVPCGVIRGALAAAGIGSTCTVDYTGGSQSTFQIKTVTKAT